MDEKAKELWEKIDKMPGGDRDPFETPLGPTEKCLTTKEVVSYAKDHTATIATVQHLQVCEVCRERVNRFRQTI